MYSLLLYTGITLSSAIEDFDTHLVSPLRGNMGAYVLVCLCRGALSSTRPPWKVVRSSVNYGEPKTLHQAEPGTKSPARFISNSVASESPQNCGMEIWSGDFRLLQSQKTPACFAPRSPQGKNKRQRAGRASLEP